MLFRSVGKLLAAFEKKGFILDRAKLIDPHTGLLSISRNKIAKGLVKAGYAKNFADAFENFIYNPKFNKDYFFRPSICDGIKMIHNSGGLAVWAHPFEILSIKEFDSYKRQTKYPLIKTQIRTLLTDLIEYGIDGLEAYYHGFDADQITFLDKLCTSKKLLKSIGTDYHHGSIIDETTGETIKEESETRSRFCFDKKEIKNIDETILDRFIKKTS